MRNSSLYLPEAIDQASTSDVWVEYMIFAKEGLYLPIPINYMPDEIAEYRAFHQEKSQICQPKTEKRSSSLGSFKEGLGEWSLQHAPGRGKIFCFVWQTDLG